MSGWIIDRDYITRDGERSRVGYGSGISGAPKDPIRFRLKDDDGEVYYGGAISESWLNGPETLAFAPLDWGAADAGCTELQYRNDDGEWRTL